MLAAWWYYLAVDDKFEVGDVERQVLRDDKAGERDGGTVGAVALSLQADADHLGVVDGDGRLLHGVDDRLGKPLRVLLNGAGQRGAKGDGDAGDGRAGRRRRRRARGWARGDAAAAVGAGGQG